METVGVLGLGMIGSALVRRLLGEGTVPFVFDVNPQAVEKTVADGGVAADSCPDLAARCDVILVCVQTDAQCAAAVGGADGLLVGARPGTCIAVLSTVLPQTITSLAARAAARGVDLVDTPVAGRGMFSVEEGTMEALVGDEGEILRRVEPVLRLFASDVVAAGPLGSGAALKLAHNVVVYAGFAALIEAIELARAVGVRDGLVEQVARTSGALSSLSGKVIPFYKHFAYEPHAPGEDASLRVAAALLEKDLSDAVALGELHGVDLPVARLIAGFGGKIFPAAPE